MADWNPGLVRRTGQERAVADTPREKVSNFNWGSPFLEIMSCLSACDEKQISPGRRLHFLVSNNPQLRSPMLLSSLISKAVGKRPSRGKVCFARPSSDSLRPCQRGPRNTAEGALSPSLSPAVRNELDHLFGIQRAILRNLMQAAATSASAPESPAGARASPGRGGSGGIRGAEGTDGAAGAEFAKGVHGGRRARRGHGRASLRPHSHTASRGRPRNAPATRPQRLSLLALASRRGCWPCPSPSSRAPGPARPRLQLEGRVAGQKGRAGHVGRAACVAGTAGGGGAHARCGGSGESRRAAVAPDLRNVASPSPHTTSPLPTPLLAPHTAALRAGTTQLCPLGS